MQLCLAIKICLKYNNYNAQHVVTMRVARQNSIKCNAYIFLRFDIQLLKFNFHIVVQIDLT